AFKNTSPMRRVARSEWATTTSTSSTATSIPRMLLGLTGVYRARRRGRQRNGRSRSHHDRPVSEFRRSPPAIGRSGAGGRTSTRTTCARHGGTGRRVGAGGSEGTAGGAHPHRRSRSAALLGKAMAEAPVSVGAAHSVRSVGLAVLGNGRGVGSGAVEEFAQQGLFAGGVQVGCPVQDGFEGDRSEERRVGKERRAGWAAAE